MNGLQTLRLGLRCNNSSVFHGVRTDKQPRVAMQPKPVCDRTPRRVAHHYTTGDVMGQKIDRKDVRVKVGNRVLDITVLRLKTMRSASYKVMHGNFLMGRIFEDRLVSHSTAWHFPSRWSKSAAESFEVICTEYVTIPGPAALT